jgi:hypothetical protein
LKIWIIPLLPILLLIILRIPLLNSLPIKPHALQVQAHSIRNEGEEVGDLGKKDAEKMIRVKVGRGLGVGDLVENTEMKLFFKISLYIQRAFITVCIYIHIHIFKPWTWRCEL